VTFSHSTVAILALAALLGTGFALAQPAEFALVPAVAGAARLQEANGAVETSRYLGFALGPIVGGVLAAAGGMRAAMLVNAVSFVAVAAAAAVIRAERRRVGRVAGAPRERANGLRNSAELFAIMGGGALVAAIGARWTLLLAGGLPALAGAAGLVAYRRMHASEAVEAPPAPAPVG
jgi:MFS family permease